MVTVAGGILAATNLFIGSSSALNRLVASDGGTVFTGGNALVGRDFGANSNSATLSGPGTSWLVSSDLYVRSNGALSRLTVSNGALVVNSNGATVRNLDAYFGFNLTGSNNLAVVTGPGSVWGNSRDLLLGLAAPANRLVMSNGGQVFARNLQLGANPSATNNRIEIHNGLLVLSNAVGTGVADIRRGTNVLNAGLFEVNRLLLTNALGFLEHNGGTLSTAGTANDNGRGFTVGNGASAATLLLRGGLHSFANNVVVANNAILAGTGTVSGILTVQPGATLTPGYPLGRLILNHSPFLQGTTILEISKTGTVVTNDVVQVDGTLTYSGALYVSLSLTNWTKLLTNQFDPIGGFIFTNAISPGVPRQFYALQLP